MIRDNIENTRAIIRTAYELARPEGQFNAEDAFAIGYRQGVFDLAGELLWPDEDNRSQRERLGRLFDAHKALFVG